MTKYIFVITAISVIHCPGCSNDQFAQKQQQNEITITFDNACKTILHPNNNQEIVTAYQTLLHQYNLAQSLQHPELDRFLFELNRKKDVYEKAKQIIEDLNKKQKQDSSINEVSNNTKYSVPYVLIIVGLIIVAVVYASSRKNNKIIKLHHLTGECNQEVRGEAAYQNELSNIVGGKKQDSANFNCYAILVPEPNNAYDKNAVVVIVNNMVVGYLPKEQCKEYKKCILKSGFGGVEVNAVIVGGWKNQKSEGHFGIILDADITEMKRRF
jgi:hypothetical protein